MKQKYRYNTLFCLLLCGLSAYAGNKKQYTISSPDNKIVFTLREQSNTIFYNVQFNGKPVIGQSPMNLFFRESDFAGNVKIINAHSGTNKEVYDLLAGKKSHVEEEYRELIITVQQNNTPFDSLEIVVRAFNGAVAFQYRLPKWRTASNFTLTNEQTVFNIDSTARIRALFFPVYTSSHEGRYNKVPVRSIPPDTLIDLPALFEYPNNTYVAITEAALVDYAGMYLSKKEGRLVSTLSPWPSDTTIKVRSSLPHNSPWRVIMVSDKPGDFISSTVLTSLNQPCRIKDVSWLIPGKTTFPWWNGNVVPDTINAPGNNFVTAKYYIDFCARNNIQYHSVVEYGLHQWYVDDGAGFQPGPHADVTTPVPGLDMKEVCDYAHTLGVGVRVWVHWAALYPKLDTAFALFEKWGLSGMMVDFMDRDDQQMVNIQNEILEKAAAHHLHIQFHGAYKPTGLSRTWPNEFTREGTMNYECNKWADYITPDMDLDIPFTRMIAGSTDYHLGGFRAVPADKITPNYTRPLMLGTRCHMLAMYAVLENYLQMVCDYPDAYEGQPGFEWIKDIPTTWDDTKVPDGKPGEYIVVARRKGNDWYVGAITGHAGRLIELPMDFLGEGTFAATLYTDAADVADNPNHLTKQEMRVTWHDKLKLPLQPGGGAAIHLTRIRE